MKKCLKCKKEFDRSLFYKCSSRKDGLQDVCKSCNNSRCRENYKNNPDYFKQKVNSRANKIKEYLFSLKSKPCADCGKTFHPCAMDFDHIYGKEKAVSIIKSRSIDRIIREVAKCELVCANCHRVRTFKRLNLTYEKRRQAYFQEI